MGFALFFNIIAVIISTAASIVLIIITVIMKEFTGDNRKHCHNTIADQCKCTYQYDDDSSSTTYGDSATCK